MQAIRIWTALAAVGMLVSGCATQQDVRRLRQPVLPIVAVVKATPQRELYRNIAIQEVQGAPEFHWLDGGGVITTRPTRAEVLNVLTEQLEAADLLAPSRLDSDYVLYVAFDDLRGPNVILGTDKLASARVTFRLVRWRTGEVVRSKTVEASYRARWAGVTPEVGRAAAGGAIGGLVIGAYADEGLLATLADGALLGLVSAQDPATKRRPTAPNEEIGAFSGGARRAAATRGLLDLAFDGFMTDLSRDGAVRFKQAVSCYALNPDGHRAAMVTETRDAFAVDCPGARYVESQGHRAIAPRF